MKDKVLAFVREHNMLTAGDKVLCALSAGADSVAMTCLLCEIKRILKVEVGAAHFSHGLRPEEAEYEKQIAQNLCAELDIPFYHEYGDTIAYCEENKKGTEEGARELRYDFLARTADKYGYNKIATAHNLNDNAETVLLNLLRGSGLRGLGGIPPVRDNIIRPVMCLSRDMIEVYVGKREVAVDKSNFTDDYTRNKLRLNVFPLLPEINENALMNIANAGMRIREENAYIEKAAEEFLINNSAGWNGDENILAFDIKELKKQEKGFLKRVIQLGYEKIGGDMGKLSSNHLDSAADLVYNKFPPKYIMMPGGINARLKNKKLLIYNREREDKIC